LGSRALDGAEDSARKQLTSSQQTTNHLHFRFVRAFFFLRNDIRSFRVGCPGNKLPRDERAAGAFPSQADAGRLGIIWEFGQLVAGNLLLFGKEDVMADSLTP
jgi:hypothetical protein